MKLPFTIVTFLFSSLVFSNWPPSEYPFGKPGKEGLELPEPGGNWKVINQHSSPPLPSPPLPPPYFPLPRGTPLPSKQNPLLLSPLLKPNQSGTQCMTPRPYYVGYGRYEPAMAQGNCISNKRDEAWIIAPHKVDTVSCKYDTNIFLVNDVFPPPPPSSSSSRTSTLNPKTPFLPRRANFLFGGFFEGFLGHYHYYYYCYC